MKERRQTASKAETRKVILHTRVADCTNACCSGVSPHTNGLQNSFRIDASPVTTLAIMPPKTVPNTFRLALPPISKLKRDGPNYSSFFNDLYSKNKHKPALLTADSINDSWTKAYANIWDGNFEAANSHMDTPEANASVQKVLEKVSCIQMAVAQARRPKDRGPRRLRLPPVAHCNIERTTYSQLVDGFEAAYPGVALDMESV